MIALVLGSIMVPLQTQIENRKIDETRRMLELAQEMLLGFAAANGYFPCPASASSNGQEPRGPTMPRAAVPLWHGFLPAALLGFRPTDAQGYALDAWEARPNRIRYAVSSSTVGGVIARAHARERHAQRAAGEPRRDAAALRLPERQRRHGRTIAGAR